MNFLSQGAYLLRSDNEKQNALGQLWGIIIKFAFLIFLPLLSVWVLMFKLPDGCVQCMGDVFPCCAERHDRVVFVFWELIGEVALFASGSLYSKGP